MSKKEPKLLQDSKKYELTIYGTDFAWAASIAVIFVLTLEMFYRMIVDYNGKYTSDMRYYVVETAVSGERHDRIITVLFQKFYDINHNTLEANIYLALVIAALVVANFAAIRYFIKDDGYGKRVPRYAIQFFSVAMLFIGPMYVPYLHEYFFRKSFASFAWHSPTQQSMTLFAVISAVCFMKMYSEYEKGGISLRSWILTMLTTLIATGFKPSYTISLCITIVVMFIVDLIRGGKNDFLWRLGQLFLMGCTAIPSGLYMLWLHFAEFEEGTQFGEEHKVIIDISHAIGYKGLWAAAIFGIAFPLTVFIIAHSKFRDSKYRFALYIFVVGVLQWALLDETGTRGNFGNFTWGRLFGCYFITLAASAAALELYYDKKRSDKKSSGGGHSRKIRIAAVSIILCWCLASQLFYFWMILTGRGYWH